MDGIDTPIGGVARIPQAPAMPPGIRLHADSGSGFSTVEIVGESGGDLALEVSTDLQTWSTVQRVVGQGLDRPVVVELTPDPAARVRFWRVRR